MRTEQHSRIHRSDRARDQSIASLGRTFSTSGSFSMKKLANINFLLVVPIMSFALFFTCGLRELREWPNGRHCTKRFTRNYYSMDRLAMSQQRCCLVLSRNILTRPGSKMKSEKSVFVLFGFTIGCALQFLRRGRDDI